MLADEVGQEPLAGGVLKHLDDHTPAPEQIFLAHERSVLADHHLGDPVEQNRPAAHRAGRERRVERALAIHRRRLPTGPLQCVHLRVEHHASRLLSPVVPAAEHAILVDQDGADRNAAFLEAEAGFVEGGAEEAVQLSRSSK
jgi:hypothetical protein